MNFRMAFEPVVVGLLIATNIVIVLHTFWMVQLQRRIDTLMVPQVKVSLSIDEQQ